MPGSRDFAPGPSERPSRQDGDRTPKGGHEEYRTRLNRLLSDDEQSAKNTLPAILQLGTEWLGLDHGILAEIDPVDGTRSARTVCPPHPALSCGTQTPLSKTFCQFLLTEDEVLAVPDAVEQDLETLSDYTERGFASYFGGKVVVDDELYGTLFFVADGSNKTSFTPTDIAVLTRLVCAVEDELERHRRSEEPCRSRPRIEALFKESPDMILVHDDMGNILDMNPRLCRKTGIDRDTLLNMRVGDLDLAETPAEKRARWSRMTPGDQVRTEGRYQRRDGSVFPVETHTRCLSVRGEDQFVVTSRDISEWKQHERALQRTRERMELALEETSSIVFEVDPTTRTVSRHGAVERFFNASPTDQETLDAFASRAVHPDDRAAFRTRFQQLLEGERTSATVEYRTNPQNGPVRWIQDNVYTYTHGEAPRRLIGLAQDVTEQKEREDDLRRKERRYQAVFDDPNILVGLLAPDGTILDANSTAMKYIEAELENVIGMQFWKSPWWTEEIRPLIRNRVERAAEGEYVEYEGDLTRPDGTPYSVAGTIRPVTNASGRVVSMIVSARDVTGRKNREQALRETTERLDGIIEASPDAIIALDLHECVELWNPAAERIFGWREEEILGRPLPIVPEGEAEESQRFRAQVHSGESIAGVEVKRRRKDGTLRDVSLSAAPLCDAQGQVVGIMAVLEDITDRKEYERDLQRTADLLARAEEMADVGGWLLDLSEGRPYSAEWTDKLYDIFELSPDEGPPTDDVFSYFHPEDRARHKEAVDRAVKTKEGWNQEIRLITAQGNERWIHNIGKTVVRDGEVVEIRGSIQDITDRKRRERELRTAKEEAERAARLKTAMLANMSHEIRTPLTSINGFSEILRDQLSGRHGTFAERIYQSGQWLINTLNSVLELSRLEAGEYSLDQKWIRLDEVVAQSAERLRPQAERKHISLAIRADGPIEAHVNEGAVTRIAENLIENAIKFTPEDGEIVVRVQEEASAAILAVEDTGIGIGTDAQSEIFVAFQQESEGLDREYGGSGLGLSITKNLVDILGGTIEVESEKGRGSCFTVRLPKEGATSTGSSSIRLKNR